MALIFIDGFESEQNITTKGQVNGGSSASPWVVDSTVKRSNGASLKMAVGLVAPGNVGYYRYYKQFSVDTSVLIIGFGWRHNLQGDQTIFEVYPSDGARYIYFTYSTDQKIRIYNQGVLIGITTTIFPVNTWFYLQFKIVSDPINGQVVMLVGNQTELNITDINTSTNNNRINRLGFRGGVIDGAAGATQWIDDLYVLDQEPPMNNFIGVCSIIGSRPTSTSDSTGFQAAGAASLQDAIDDNSTSTSDYIYASNVNDKAVFALSDITTSGQIKGVLFHDYAARSEAGQGISKYRFLCQDSTGQEYESGDLSLTASAYSPHYFIFENNPITDSTQTQEGFNSMKAGFRVTQSS